MIRPEGPRQRKVETGFPLADKRERVCAEIMLK